MRVGQGFDAHAFAPDRPLVLGGVTVPFDRGLAGHSDADVLLHAVCDALLGAAGRGDLGGHFPGTDAAYAGRNSRDLVREVAVLLRSDGWAVGNIDATVIAQRPRLKPYVTDMRANLAADLAIGLEQVSVKATTTEHLGFEGEEQGISAHAVCLIEKP